MPRDPGRSEADMANTKSLSGEMRKGVKRSQRKNLKAAFGTLTGEQMARLRKSEETIGVRAFIASEAAAAAGDDE